MRIDGTKGMDLLGGDAEASGLVAGRFGGDFPGSAWFVVREGGGGLEGACGGSGGLGHDVAEGEDGAEGGVCFLLGDGELRRHGDLTPSAAAAFLELLFEGFEGFGLILVAEGDIGVAGADRFGVRLVAGEAEPGGEGLGDGFGQTDDAGVVAGRGDVAEADHRLGRIAEALDLEAKGSSGSERFGGEFEFELRLLIGTVEGDAGDAAVAGSVDGDGPQFAAGVGGDRDGRAGGQFRFGSADGEPPLHRYFFVLGITGGLYLPAIGLTGDSLHLQRRCLVPSAGTNAADAAVAVEIPTGTVFEEPVGAIGGQLEVHRMAEAVGDLHQLLEVIILVKFRLPEFAAHPIVGDETVVIFFGEKIPGALGIVVENRAGHGVAAAGFHDRELGGFGVGIPDKGLLGRG